MQRALLVIGVTGWVWGFAACGGTGVEGGNDAAMTGDAGGPVADGPSSTDSAMPAADGATPATDAAAEDTGSRPADGGPTDAPPVDLGTDGATATGRVRFVAMGDTGRANKEQYQVAQAVADKCNASGCDFVQLLGDNIYNSGVDSVEDDQFRTKFEVPYAAIDLPFYVVLGNHDYGGDGLGFEFQRAQFQVEYTQRSSKWHMPAPHYNFSMAHVEFFATDTNSQLYGRDDQQREDFQGWIAASTARWKIAFGHHPYLSNGRHGNAGEYDGLPFVPIANGAGVKEFVESTLCGRVDFYITGHDHNRQFLQETCGGTHLIVSGAGSDVTELRGNNAVRFQAASLGFVYLDIDGDTARIEFVDANGVVEYTESVSK